MTTSRNKLGSMPRLTFAPPLALILSTVSGFASWGCSDNVARVIARRPAELPAIVDASSTVQPDSSTRPDAVQPDAALVNPTELIGFAAIPGNGLDSTTGGGQAAPDYATTCDNLKSLLKDSTPRVVVVPASWTIDCRTATKDISACEIPCDTIDCFASATSGAGQYKWRVLDNGNTCDDYYIGSAQVPRTRNESKIDVASNKTLLGLGAGATVQGCTLNLKGSSNIIIRNLSLQNINYDLREAGDAITLDGSDHIWVDHCYFHNISDGFVDIIGTSTYVTVSWNHFDGFNPLACGGQHNTTHNVDNSTGTFHHNFYDHTSGYSPKLGSASTRAHLFNNYWLGVANYTVEVSDSAQALIEANYFSDACRPHWSNAGVIQVPVGSNRYVGVSADDAQNKDNTGTVDAIPYDYTVDPADGVPGVVEAGSGPRVLQ